MSFRTCTSTMGCQVNGSGTFERASACISRITSYGYLPTISVSDFSSRGLSAVILFKRSLGGHPGDRPEQSYKILVEYFPYSVDLSLSVHKSLWSRQHWKITRILCPGCLQGCQYTMETRDEAYLISQSHTIALLTRRLLSHYQGFHMRILTYMVSLYVCP